MINPILLIDADIVVYQSCAAVEKGIQWDEDTFTIHSTLEDAKGVFYEFFHDLKEQSGTDNVLFCFSSKGNFRKKIWDGYKANRTQRKPLAYSALVKYVEDTYPNQSIPTLEADDVLGILATGLHKENGIIWSIDKDLMQIPGKHLIDDEIVEVTKEDGDEFHLFQTLCGDSSDGYKGCPGIGPVKAKGITKWSEVVTRFEKAGLTEDDALVQARLAKILQTEDYNKKKVVQWTPK